MQIQNVDRIMIFRPGANGGVSTLEQLQAQYGIDPDGTNFYYGINKINVDNFTTTGTALNPTHQAFFDTLQASIAASPDDEKTLQLGLEPPEKKLTTDPYGYVTAHLDLVKQLAVDLNDQQNTARDAGKRLNITVRYASEMNDPGQNQGNKPNGFKSTFAQVKHAFAESAPSILLSFSPGLRADLNQALIGQYWPGDEFVDIVGGTWYIGAPSQQAASVANMRAYFLHPPGAAKSFALSEMGGCTTIPAKGKVPPNREHGKNNDQVLQSMFHELEGLQIAGVSFKYVTIFLAVKWGDDATLKFLRTA